MDSQTNLLLKRAQKEKALKRYFYIKVDDGDIKDIRDELKGIEKEEVANLHEVSSLSKDELMYLWGKVNKREKEVNRFTNEFYTNTFENEFQKEKEIYEERMEFERFVNEKSKLESSPFEVSKTIVTITFENLEGIDQIDIFDSMRTSFLIPLIKYKHLTKVHSSYIVKDLKNVNEDNLTFHLPNENVLGEFVDGKLELSVPTVDNELIKKILEHFEMDMKVKSMVTDTVNGTFTISFSSKAKIDKNVFALFVLENHLVNKLILIDEHKKIITEKDNLWIVVYDNFINVAKTASIVVREQEISVRLRNIKKNEVQKYINLISKTFELYFEEYISIENEYKKWCTGFKMKDLSTGSQTQNKTKFKINQLREKDSSGLFEYDYVRLCQYKIQPKIISKEEAKKLMAVDKNFVMKYPPHYYTCDVGTHPYPGLKINKSEKSQKYIYNHPFVPCCYPTPQIDKKTSKYNLWKHGEPKKPITTLLNEKTIITEDKRKGYLTIGVKTLLSNTLDGVDVETLLRIGVSKSSESILLLLGQIFGEKVDRKQLSSKGVLLKQEFYDHTVETIEKYLLDGDYIDVTKIVPLIENIYKVNVFLFVDQRVSVPHNKRGYIYKSKNQDQSIIIHARSVNANFYQSEAIIREDGTYFFSQKEVKNLKELFENIQSLYTLEGKQLPRHHLKDYDYLCEKATHQYIDSCGKVQALRFNFENEKVFCFINPSFPSDTKSYNHSDIKILKTPIKTVLSFISKLENDKVKSQYIVDNNCVAVITMNGLIFTTFGTKIKNIPVINDLPIYNVFSSTKKGIYGQYFENYQKANSIKKIILQTKDVQIKYKAGDISFEEKKGILYVNDRELKERLDLAKNNFLFYDESIRQFKKRDNEIVFMNEKQLNLWKDKKVEDDLIHTLKTIDVKRKTMYYLLNQNKIIGIKNTNEVGEDDNTFKYRDGSEATIVY